MEVWRYGGLEAARRSEGPKTAARSGGGGGGEVGGGVAKNAVQMKAKGGGGEVGVPQGTCT